MTKFKDGIYKGKAAGHNGEIKVEVSLENDKITNVEIVEHHETEGISDVSFEKTPKNIVKNQSYNIDTVSGATISSAGIINAVKNALESLPNYDEEFEENYKVDAESNDKKQMSVNTFKHVNPEELTWASEHDVVVVGAGGAGLAAAVQACDNESSVLVLEYFSNHLLSDTALSGGVYYTGGGTSLQKEAGIEDSIEDWREYLDFVGKGLENEELKEVLIEETPKNLEWLIDMGANFKADLTYMSGMEQEISDKFRPVARGHQTEEKTGASISDALYERAKSLGADFSFETEALKLITDVSGRVIGVHTDKGNFKATEGVVLATAGFSRNKEMHRAYMPQLQEGAYGSFGSMKQQGDGIRMGLDIGAKIGNMYMTVSDTVGTRTSEEMWPIIVIPIWGNPCIMVGQDGKRKVSEDLYYEFQTNIIDELPGRFVWTIWDQNVTDKGSVNITAPPASEGLKREVEEGYFLKANSIEELAEKIDVAPDVLTETVDNYNKMMREGEDTEFGRKTGLGEVKEAPFYACKTVRTVCDTGGGLIINKDAEVLDNWDQPIPGLYAGGTTSTGWRGEYYAGSGQAISSAITMGRIAGDTVSTQ